MTRIILYALVLLAFVPSGGEPEPGRALRTAQRSNLAATRSAAPAGVIGLSHKALGTAAVGQPLRVRVTLSSPFPLTSLTAQVYAHDGLVVSPQRLKVFELKAHEPVEWTVTVTPYMAGALRFSVLARGEVDGRFQAGQLTVPVQVMDTPSEPVPMDASNTNESQNPIIALPAPER